MNREDVDAILRLGLSAHLELLRIASDEQRPDLERVNALALLPRLQGYGDASEVRGRDRGPLLQSLLATMASNRRKVRTAAVATTIQLAGLAERGWLSGVTVDIEKVLRPALERAVELGLDKRVLQAVDKFLSHDR